MQCRESSANRSTERLSLWKQCVSGERRERFCLLDVCVSEGGFAPGEVSLAIGYIKGVGELKIDKTEALRLLANAAQKDDYDAAWLLVRRYQGNYGVAADKDKEAYWATVSRKIYADEHQPAVTLGGLVNGVPGILGDAAGSGPSMQEIEDARMACASGNTTACGDAIRLKQEREDVQQEYRDAAQH